MTETCIVVIAKDLEGLIPDFLDRRHTDVEKLIEHLAQSQFEDIRILGHTLKGTAGSYGFKDLSRIGAALEVASRTEDIVAVQALIDEMSTYLTKVKVEFR